MWTEGLSTADRPQKKKKKTGTATAAATTARLTMARQGSIDPAVDVVLHSKPLRVGIIAVSLPNVVLLVSQI